VLANDRDPNDRDERDGDERDGDDHEARMLEPNLHQRTSTHRLR
jgi:hypothetical protein